MALVLATELRIGLDGTDKDGRPKVKIVEEGTEFKKLTKAEKEMAKELGLLKQVRDEPTLEEELETESEEEVEETETEDSEDE